MTKQDLSQCNKLIAQFETVIKKPIKNVKSIAYTGVDLGTACIVLSVMDQDNNPIAGAYEYADVVRDGMVVDYIGAIDIVRRLKEQIENELGIELLYAAAAIPPGTDQLDSGAIANVVQAAGFELVALLDEPSAANQILKIQNGAVVDIGGGTTGIAILKDGHVVKVADEATGGKHFSLVIAGAQKIALEEAELFKRNPKNHELLQLTLKPVIDKISSIIQHEIVGYDIHNIYLVGGTACLGGIEKMMNEKLAIPTFKPENPMFVTPLGIAKLCVSEAK